MNYICLAPRALHSRQAWCDAPGNRNHPKNVSAKNAIRARAESRFQRLGICTTGTPGALPQARMRQRRWR